MNRPSGRQVAVAAVLALLFVSGLGLVARTAFGGPDAPASPVPATRAPGPTVAGTVDPGTTEPGTTSPEPSGGRTGPRGTSAPPPTRTPKPSPRPPKPSTPPSTTSEPPRVVHLAGATLDNSFPDNGFDSFVDGQIALNDGRMCGYLVNDLGVAVDVRASVETAAGEPELVTDCGDDYADDFGGGAGPPCAGATVADGEGCWLGLRMVVLPELPSTGIITIELGWNCPDVAAEPCATAAEQDGTEPPFEVTAGQTWFFRVDVERDDE